MTRCLIGFCALAALACASPTTRSDCRFEYDAKAKLGAVVCGNAVLFEFPGYDPARAKPWNPQAIVDSPMPEKPEPGEDGRSLPLQDRGPNSVRALDTSSWPLCKDVDVTQKNVQCRELRSRSGNLLMGVFNCKNAREHCVDPGDGSILYTPTPGEVQ